MKTFEYTARDLAGQTTTGRSVAASEREVDRELEKQGLTLVQVRAVRGAARGKARLSRDEVVAFTNQLATVIAAGVPILSGIEDLGARMRTPSGRRVLGELAADLRAGRSLADAMEQQAGSFPTLYLASIRAGELSGQLPTILRRLAASLGLDADAVLAAMDSEGVTEQLSKTRALAQQLQITGTPSFVMGDQMIRGYLPLEAMRDVIAEERSEG